MEPGSETWRRCSACKTGIAFGADHFVCNVSTCNKPRTGLVFCTVSCWETHVPVMNHRESWAVEKKAPTREAWRHEQQSAAGGVAPTKLSGPVPSPSGRPGVMAAMPAPRPSAPARTSGSARPSGAARSRGAESGAHDVLVVASKLKAYVKAISGMNTSDGVMEPLSDWLRSVAAEAIRNAERDGRKTLLDRDVPRKPHS